MMDASIRLYDNLAKKASAAMPAVSASHPTLFKPDSNSHDYYRRLYLDQRGKKPCKRPGDSTCTSCEPFFLANLKLIDKEQDIELGHALEDCFRDFLTEQLRTQGIPARCKPADTEDYHLPDFKVVSKDGSRVISYFEFKVIFRPFIKIAEKVDQSFKCYSNSLTLDLENGKKLQEQRTRVENDLGLDNVLYVYWYDLPCVKGVFWLPARKVYEHMDNQKPYDRKNVKGDYNASGRKFGATRKIYLPLVEMSDFFSLIERFSQASGG